MNRHLMNTLTRFPADGSQIQGPVLFQPAKPAFNDVALVAIASQILSVVALVRLRPAWSIVRFSRFRLERATR